MSIEGGKVATGGMSRTERRKAETRKRIIDTAMELFNQQGFDETTVDQIAIEADVAKGTIYNHFPEKEAIINAHIQEVIKEQGPEAIALWQQLPDTRSRLISALKQSLQWMHIDMRSELYEKYFTYKMSKVVQSLKGQGPNVSSGFRAVLENILKQGQIRGEVREDLEVPFLAAQLELNYFVIAICWVVYPEMSSINESIENSVALFLDGAGKRPCDN